MTPNTPNYIGKFSYTYNHSTYSTFKDERDKRALINGHIENYRSDSDGKTIVEENIVTLLCQLPYDFLDTFFKQGFKIIISNASDDESENSGNAKTLAKINYDDKYIVVYKEDTVGISIIHELGHWFTFYVQDNYDPLIFDRVSDDMVKELNNIEGVSNFSLEYYKSDKYETCAALFERYILDPNHKNEYFPISCVFYDYYMKVFKTQNSV